MGLSRRSRIYLGKRLLCDAASSYDLCPPRGFLSYVTLGSRCTLRSVPISVLAAHAGCGYDDRHPANEDEDNALLLMGEGYEPRSAERGSALITVLSDKPSAILQMPRGNLEALYPRSLVLPHVMGLISKGEYGSAVEVMRRQKVDLNLL